MNRIIPTSFFTGLFAILILLITANGQTLKEHINKFNSLSPSQQKEFSDSLQESTKLIREKRIFDALYALEGARKLLPDNPKVLESIANIYVETRQFELARKLFLEQYINRPRDVTLAFNIGEMHFVQDEWKQAQKYFKEAQQFNKSPQSSFAHLTKFKIYICDKKLGNKSETDEVENAYDYTADSPIYYYVNFVKYFADGNTVEAQKWSQKASRIFNSQTLLSWADTIEEAGSFKNME